MATRESEVIYANNVNVTNVTGYVKGLGTALEFYLGVCTTWDGVYTWEKVIDVGVQVSEVTNTFTHTMTAVGKFLKWKGVGTSYQLNGINIQI